MTDAQKIQIGKYRASGLGYKKIAERMGLSENTVKTYCRRHGLGGNMAQQQKVVQNEGHHCLYCGAAVQQTQGRKEKKFCSDRCRNKWWNSNLDKVRRKAVYLFECPTCKEQFTAYGNSKRKYCSCKCSANRNKGVINYGRSNGAY